MLVADVGGTNTRCGLGTANQDVFAIQTFVNDDYATLREVLETYLNNQAQQPALAALGIAGPILKDRVELSNRDWGFSQSALRDQLGLDRLDAVNDFTALAYALPTLSANDLTQIGPGSPKPDSPMGVLGPGTGLGVSGLVRSATGWTALAGEGGHADLSATTREEAEIVDILTRSHGHCSAERVLSGPGLVNLFHARRQFLGYEHTDITPAEITDGAMAGDDECMAVMDLFFAFLGNAAGNLALLLGSHGGVFVGGGIVPKCIELVPRSPFREKFEAKGRFQNYLAHIPTFVIMGETPALTGLRNYLVEVQN